MALPDLGRFVRRFARDIREQTRGFDRVIGQMAAPDANMERTGDRVARDRPTGGTALTRSDDRGDLIAFDREKKRREPLY